MARDPLDFLRRWSRRKLEAATQAPAEAPASGELPPLPSPDSLSFESDFKAFMHAKVKESVKRAALKKLFSDPRFNVMDGLDTYIDDYTKDDPIPQAMLARLEHAKATLFGRGEEKQKEEETPREPKPEALAQAPEHADEQQEKTKKEDDGAAG